MPNTKLLLHFNKTLIVQIDKPRIICFQAGMAIDADGCPHAYHPDNIGLDDLKHGGHTGNWWGVATDNESCSGNPLIQNKNDPAPGYYVSTTSLINTGYSYRDPARYVNAQKIPYFVLPEQLLGLITLGDVAWIFNTEIKLNCFAIFADVGPDVGEGSIHLAKKLGIHGDPRIGGADSGILYFIFKGSGRGNGVHLTETEIIQTGEKAMEDLGEFELTSIFR
jgi:hypothetical protein